MYWQFGDEKALPQQYESMKKFVEAEIRKMEGRNLWLGVSLGDWLALGKDIRHSIRQPEMPTFKCL